MKPLWELVDFIKAISPENIKNINKMNEKLWALKARAVRVFPFSNKFVRIINKFPQKKLQNPLEIFEKFFEKTFECPVCGSTSLTEDVFFCSGYSTKDHRIVSLTPIEVETIQATPFVTDEACDAMGMSGHCYYCSGSGHVSRSQVQSGIYFC